MKELIKLVCFVVCSLFLLVLFSCVGISIRDKCDNNDPDFRPHKVRHCNKSKTYSYYHNEPCDCPGIRKDLELDSHFGKTYRNYVEYYDNGEIVWGR